ncbi:hypothetical protein [Nonomuraea longispora]|nr:hypothetical protein [Nonomuraea longispora]
MNETLTLHPDGRILAHDPPRVFAHTGDPSARGAWRAHVEELASSLVE